MPASFPTDYLEQMTEILTAWKQVDPDLKVGDLTLAQASELAAAARAADEEVTDLNLQAAPPSTTATPSSSPSATSPPASAASSAAPTAPTRPNTPKSAARGRASGSRGRGRRRRKLEHALRLWGDLRTDAARPSLSPTQSGNPEQCHSRCVRHQRTVSLALGAR